jgi:hypothetical protein
MTAKIIQNGTAKKIPIQTNNPLKFVVLIYT